MYRWSGNLTGEKKLSFVMATEILASEAYPSLSAVMHLIVNLCKYYLSTNDQDIKFRESIRWSEEEVYMHHPLHFVMHVY